MGKMFIDVLCMHSKTGDIQPVAVIWDNGAKYYIDKVERVVFRASLKSGGVGIRYTCRIQDQMRYLFLEGDKWFIEKVY